MTQQELAQQFKEFHVSGSPIILYNIWDAGSAQAVASCGAKAIASGSHGVANAFGYEDGEKLPLEDALANAVRIVGSVELPVTMDIETGYGATPEDVYNAASRVIATGVVGVNVEDQKLGTTELRELDEQVERLKAVRRAADDANIPLFINARTDLFKNAEEADHNEAMVEAALTRAQAFADAGADGFFVPGLRNPMLIKKLCDASPLPVNIISLPGMVGNVELAQAGVARISYGPVPYLQMIDWLKEKAGSVLGQ